MPAKIRISKRIQVRIERLYENDLLFATEIARRLGLTDTVVKRVLRELGVKSRGTYRPPVIGTEFNNTQLRVIRLARPGLGRNGWLQTRVWVRCKCNGPNSLFMVPAYRLRSANVRSCGCLWLGSPNYRPHPDREWRRILRTYCTNHAEFSLNLAHIKLICALPCFYCGTPPNNELMGRYLRVSTRQVVLRYSGIDEVICEKGHVIGNVLPACIICNRAKSDSTLEEWCQYTGTNPNSVRQAARKLAERLKQTENGLL